MPFTTYPDVHTLRDRFASSRDITDTLDRDAKNDIFKTLVHASGNDLTTMLLLPHVSETNHTGDSFESIGLFATKADALTHIDDYLNDLSGMNTFVEPDVTFDGFVVRPYGYEEPSANDETKPAVYCVAIWKE